MTNLTLDVSGAPEAFLVGNEPLPGDVYSKAGGPRPWLSKPPVEVMARTLFIRTWGEPESWADEEDELEVIFRPNAQAALDALDALKAEGWVVVPREPTERMTLAGIQGLPFGTSSPAMAAQTYRAMLSAAEREAAPADTERRP